MDSLLLFLGIWAASYAAHLALYFGQGVILTAINRRHPERRIQPKRRGEDRARVEILASVKSLVVTSGCLAGGIFLPMQGITLWPPLELTWISGIGMFALTLLLYDTWFYWGHRLMHVRALYKHHFWHHRSVAPTVWSNYSDTLIDAFAMQSFYLVMPLILPIPPVVLVAARLWDHVNGQIGHSGFEYFADRTTRFPSPMVCVTFHDQHHEHFNYNFANYFSLWDRICGTLDPDYDRKVGEFEQIRQTR
ncbi:MAG: fatty acid hydroxylase family protein [Alphaproteobacteria bacterium]|nr:MAG: fatty acid hydroxylase family protein [Alphaproteobacteria bacterium]